MLITGLSNANDGGGKTALVEYSNQGEYVRTIWMPEGAVYGYDVRVNAILNRMLTSSFTGKNNYMRTLPRADAGRRRDEELRQHDGGLGLPHAEAAPDARGAGRAARDPLGAAAASTTTPSPRRRSPAGSGASSSATTAPS